MFRRRGICFWIGIACVVAGVFIILALVWLNSCRPASGGLCSAVRSLRRAFGCCAVDGCITGVCPA